jgi:carboxymethylenebutenolidase
MCHDDDALPPQPPDPGPVARHGHLELQADDGNVFAAYEAVPETVRRGNLILLPDRRGLHPFYFRLTQAFAAAGFHTVAFDYFGRTAGTGDRGEGFPWGEHGMYLQPDHVLADARAVAGRLRAAQDAPVFSVGFCMGGGHSWRLAASDLGLAGAIGLYGLPVMVYGVLDRLNAPIQILVAGADTVSPVHAFEALARHLEERGKAFDMRVYEGAPHAYFDEHFTEWAQACEQTWEAMLGFADSVAPARAG